MPKTRKTKPSLLERLKSKPVLIVIALLPIAGIGLGYLQLKDSPFASETASDTSDPQSGEYINLNPPTEQEQQDAEDNKKALVEESSPQPPASNGKKQVTPEITGADHSEVRAFVPGVFEDGGICTATATKGSQTKTATSKGFMNVSYTQCEPIEWSLSGSDWSVVVSYNSTTAQGSSESFEVN